MGGLKNCSRSKKNVPPRGEKLGTAALICVRPVRLRSGRENSDWVCPFLGANWETKGDSKLS